MSIKPRNYEVQPGDTFWGIAAKCGVSVPMLQAFNPQIADDSMIMPGDIVHLNESSSHPATRTDGDFTSPVNPNCHNAKPEDWYISIGFNKVYAYPPAYKGQTHSGIDLLNKNEASYGKPFFAIAAGAVIYAQEAPVWGNVVVVRHGSEDDDSLMHSRYAHGSRLSVKSGDWVERGDELGKIGGGPEKNGKTSFVPHLHFDVCKGNYFKSDPIVWDGHKPANIPKYYLNPLALI